MAGVASLLLRAELPGSVRRRVPRSVRSIDPVELLRLVLVIAQGAMIAVTWPLWQARTDIPRFNISGAAVGTQVPASPRIFEAWFQSICRPGDELRITGMRLRPPLDDLGVAQSSTSTCERS